MNEVPPFRVSIITATMNANATILSCVDSVAKQSYADIEHLIIDGKSTDGTLELLKDAGFNQEKLISEADNGIYDALNKGVMKATGDVIGFVHSDDVLAYSKAVNDIVEIFENNTKCVAVYADLEYVSSKDLGKTIRRWKSGPFNKAQLAFGWMPPHPTLFVRKSVYQELGLFDEKYQISADYEFVLRLFDRYGGQTSYLNKTTVLMRMGGASNKSLKNIAHKTKEDFVALRENGYGLLSSIKALVCKNVSKIFQFLI